MSLGWQKFGIRGEMSRNLVLRLGDLGFNEPMAKSLISVLQIKREIKLHLNIVKRTKIHYQFDNKFIIHQSSLV